MTLLFRIESMHRFMEFVPLQWISGCVACLQRTGWWWGYLSCLEKDLSLLPLLSLFLQLVKLLKEPQLGTHVTATLVAALLLNHRRPIRTVPSETKRKIDWMEHNLYQRQSLGVLHTINISHAYIMHIYLYLFNQNGVNPANWCSGTVFWHYF